MEGWKVGVAAVLLCTVPSFHLSAQDSRARALRILKTVPLIDGHNDIADAISQRGGLDSVDLAASQPTLMTDIPRLRAGAVGGQFWAAYVPVTTLDSGSHPAVYALEQIDLIKRLCARYPRDLAMAYRAADVERNFKAGKISCLIGIEGGHAIENSLGTLRMFAALGVRYITLTHWRSLSWATASTDTARRGLSAFGREVVHEMNRLGVLVDLSHVNDGTMSDALHTAHAPVMFSHSSARALTHHARDVPDSILRLVPANGGIVMVNFNPGFVSEGVRVYEDSLEGRARALRASGTDSTALRDSLKAWHVRAPKARLQQVADHIDYLRRVVGVDHVGLGSDFDGITEVPVGLEDVSKFPDLIAELLKRGWTEQDVRKVAGTNVLRVLQDADAAVSAEADFLEHDRPLGQKHAVAPRDQEEEQREGDVDVAEREARDRDHVPQDLDQRRQRLPESKERHRDQSDRSVPGVEKHAFVQPHRGDEAPVPALPLARQDPARLRHLRPRHGIGNERNFVRDALLPQIAVQPHHQIQVFHDARHTVAADGEEVLLAEQAECAGDHQAAAQPVPAEPAEQKRPQILDDLHAGEKTARHPGVGDPAVAHRATVRYPDRAPDRRDFAAEQERPREAQQGVGLDQGVRVHGDDEREAARVDGGVE